MKLLLCICLPIVCTACAYFLTQKYKRRKEFFYNLSMFNERLVNEVSYTKVPLPAFMEKYEFSGDFRKMLEERKSAEFSARISSPAYLTADERKFLIDYFGMIGRSDAASQKTYLSSLRTEIEERRKNSDETYKKYFALYIKLGFLAGLMLSILIV